MSKKLIASEIDAIEDDIVIVCKLLVASDDTSTETPYSVLENLIQRTDRVTGNSLANVFKLAGLFNNVCGRLVGSLNHAFPAHERGKDIPALDVFFDVTDRLLNRVGHSFTPTSESWNARRLERS